MNRDEARTRAHAHPPEKSVSGATEYIRPVDGDKGGTWIGVNQHGVSMCIMNWHSARQPDIDPGTFISRGWIIPNLMDAEDLDDCRQQLEQLSLQKIKPFRLLAIQPDPVAVGEWWWDMNELQLQSPPPERNIWTSSGWKPGHVHRIRKRVFDNFWKNQNKVTIDSVRLLHATQLPEAGPLAISMSHPKAMSVSNTIVKVTPEETIMHYLDGFPATSHDWYENTMDRLSDKKTVSIGK